MFSAVAARPKLYGSPDPGYESNLGRFMGPDQRRLSIRDVINPQKWNKYAYTTNNPLRYFDPNGMEQIEVELRAFIPQSSMLGFRGDNRGFTTGQDVTSRTSIAVRVETDPAKSQNPLLNTPKGVAGQTEFILTGTTATQTEGLPTAQVSRDANGNVVINLKEDASNPLVPGAPPIKGDLTLTIPPSGSSVTTAGTVSGDPAFELNVSTEGGTDVNVPLQSAPSSTLGFAMGLPQTNSILNLTPLPPPPPPPPPCTDSQQTSCPR